MAVLDTGLDYSHPDLKPNLNVGDSKSFVPGEPKEYRRRNVFSHASHVAGIIGAADSKFYDCHNPWW